MGQAEFGGDGSVAWEVDVDDVRGTPTSAAKTPKGHKQTGIDPSKGAPGHPGDKFTVRVKPPAGQSAADFRNSLCNGGLTTQGNKVVFELEIEANNKDQIRVEW